MIAKAVQNYVDLVNGLTKMTRDSSLAMARVLLAGAGLGDVASGAGERVTKLSEEILLANRANRELVENLVAAEVDKAAARWGFVRTADVDALREEVAELHRELSRVKADATPQPAAPAPEKASRVRRGTSRPAAQQPPLGGAPADHVSDPGPSELVPSKPLPYEPGPIQPTSSAARKAPAKKATAKKSTANRTAANKAAAKPPARKAAGKKAATQKTTARKATARKTAARSAGQEGIAVPGQEDSVLHVPTFEDSDATGADPGSPAADGATSDRPSSDSPNSDSPNSDSPNSDSPDSGGLAAVLLSGDEPTDPVREIAEQLAPVVELPTTPPPPPPLDDVQVDE